MTLKYEVRWSHDAKKTPEKIGPDYQERFKRMVKVLEESLYHYGKAIKRLSGELSSLVFIATELAN